MNSWLREAAPASSSRQIRQWAGRLVIGALLMWAPLSASGHSRTTSFGTVAFHSNHVSWRIRVVATDLLAPMGIRETTPRELVAAALKPKLPNARAYVAAKLAVLRGARSCEGGTAHARWEEPAATPPVVEFAYEFSCSSGSGPFRLQYHLFFDLDPLHSGFVQLTRQGVSIGHDVFRNDNREHIVMMADSAWRQARRFWLLGVEHIFTGYDHLAFLAGLLLLAAVVRQRQGWQAASTQQAFVTTTKLVTAFTMAHSFTLVLAALRPQVVPTAWVEPAIALSVILVGVENLLPRMPKRRWLLAMGFGLVHGFGFSSVLREVGLPQHGFISAVLAFNIGVECGQLAVVALVLPTLVWLARHRPRLYTRVLLQAGSVALILAGLFWLIERLRG